MAELWTRTAGNNQRATTSTRRSGKAVLTSAVGPERNRKERDQNRTPGTAPRAVLAAKCQVVPGGLSARGAGCWSRHSPVGSTALRQHPSEPPTSRLPGQDSSSTAEPPESSVAGPKSGHSLPHADRRLLCLACCRPAARPSRGLWGRGPLINCPRQPAVPSSKASTAHLALLRETSKAQATPLLPGSLPPSSRE